MFEEIKDPVMCPYCGSIDNNGITCRWCRNKITDDYESEEQPMNVELRFTGLTPKLALRLIEVVNESGEQPDINIPMTSASRIAGETKPAAPAAPVAQPAAPVNTAPMPATPAAPPSPYTTYGAAAPGTPPQAATQSLPGAIPTAPMQPPVANAPMPAQAPMTAAAPPQPMPGAIPTAPPPQYDIEMLGRAAAPLAAAGKRPELFALLQSFGVQTLNALPKERYGEMAIALRGLGAKI